VPVAEHLSDCREITVGMHAAIVPP
jgi:hypothetical protein